MMFDTTPSSACLPRRAALAAALAAVLAGGVLPQGWAQGSTASSTANWPNKPITFVVPQAPGGANDVIARAVAQGLGQSLGQPVIVENRAGANGNVGTSQVARSAADGYTFLVTAQSAYTINPALYSSVPFDPIKDFTPVMQLAVAPYLLVVNPNFPAKNLDELVAYAKQHPGKVEYASAGNGTLNHLLGEMLKKQKGVDLLHVPYKGASAAATDVVAGQLPMTFGSFPGVMPFVTSGKLRVLGVASDKPTQLAPEIPPLGKPGRHQLVRPVCTSRHARYRRRAPACRDHQGAGHAGDGRAPEDPGRGVCGVDPAELQGQPAGRAGLLEAGGAGLGSAH